MRVVALALLALAIAAPAAASSLRPSESALETELVCPVCHETLDESTAPVAQEMKELIRKRIAQGWTKQQILAEMVRNFGPGVLSTPATHGFDLLAWVLPIGGALLGAAGLAGGAWYWSRGRQPDPPPRPEPSLDPETERRLDEALAQFDG
ncbi:MAG: cytochrome c-type biogenesis protein [Gaiellaceae bacterium]